MEAAGSLNRVPRGDLLDDVVIKEKARRRREKVMEAAGDAYLVVISSTMWSSPGRNGVSIPVKLCSLSNSDSHPRAWLVRNPNLTSAASNALRCLRPRE